VRHIRLIWNKEVPLRLHSLLRHLGHLGQYGATGIDLAQLPDVLIRTIDDDSRRIEAGDIFVAREGTQTTGDTFALDAVRRGAVVVIARRRINAINVPQIIVQNPALVFAKLSMALAGHPSQFVKTIGVTGTNGKTTTTYLIRDILNAVQHRCGMIGTVQIDDGAGCTDSSMTTPGARDLADLLSTMRSNHCHACAIETSSHALDQHRTAGLQFAGAGFTNLTGDHLDYHGTMDNYAAAKARLFEQLPPDGIAAVNIDSPWHVRMLRDCDARIYTFGIQQNADYRATDTAVTSHGTSFILNAPDGKTEVALKLIGRHNIENALCAITLCCEVFGLTIHQVASALRNARGAPGRLQSVSSGQPFAVLVDYAHTDDALQNVLTSLRPLARNGRLRVVFGCGGDRDKTKRPRMARVAEKYADAIYVTSDNPRTEDAELIVQQIVDGFSHAERNKVCVDTDRRAAIVRAITDCEPGDVLLIAGKGHENYQIVGAQKFHFDDVEEATSAIQASQHTYRPGRR